MHRRSANAGFAAAALLMLGLLGWLVSLVPVDDGAREWTGSLNPGGWMAWTFPTALFFWVIAALLLIVLTACGGLPTSGPVNAGKSIPDADTNGGVVFFPDKPSPDATPEQIVETVLQEDADAVGLSVLSGAHMTLVPKVVELLEAQDAGDVVVTVGGTIPADDIPELKKLGVAEVFTPGSPTQEIVDFIRGAVAD